ncbi:MAG: hypothetical protein P1U56_20550 [Saprospiraceae bacterium]|nr:hypothetical protein [Saprospiraceae bacterium]
MICIKDFNPSQSQKVSKHFVLLFLFTLFNQNPLFAQGEHSNTDINTSKYHFFKGDRAFNINVDLEDNYNGVVTFINRGFVKSSIPKITVEYETGIDNKLSLSPLISYGQIELKTPFNSDDLYGLSSIDSSDVDAFINSTECTSSGSACEAFISKEQKSFTIGGKLKYQESPIRTVNTYFLLGFGYTFFQSNSVIHPILQNSFDDETIIINATNFNYYYGVGLRIFLSQHVGVYGEYTRGNIKLINVGLSFRL